MIGQPVDHALVGRTRELDAIVALLDADSAMIGFAGEPGIGKTALLAEAARLARNRGRQVLTVVGVPAEAQLPFAGLHQLLGPVFDLIEHLPDAERAALRTAFGLAGGPAPEPFLIARAARNLIEGAATDRPMLIVVDDVQWLDEPSYQALTYLTRRAPTTGFGLIVGQRVETGRPHRDIGAAGVHTLTVAGLDADSAREILLRHAAHLSGADRRRIREEARGNPLALLELPSIWSTGSDAAGEPVGTLTTRLERAFAGRIADLPTAGRDMMLIAALHPTGNLTEILAATAILHGRPIGRRTLDEAAEVGLLAAPISPVQFRHPLVRSGVVQAEPVSRRQAAHAALAQALHTDPTLRAWHRAQAIVGPADDVADELAATVGDYLGRGAVMSAIAAMERSAQLTTGSAARGHRLLTAAEHAFGLGRVDLVDRLVQAAARTDLSELDWARMQWLREIFNDGVPGDATRVVELCDIATRSAAAHDVDLALNLLLGAALRCWWADTGPAARSRVVEVTRSLSAAASDPRSIATLAVAEPVALAPVVDDLLDAAPPPDTITATDLRLLGMAAHAIGDEPRAADLLDAAEARLRGDDQLGLLAHVLSMQVIIRLELGDWDRALVAADEGRRLAEETGQPIWTTGTIACEARAYALRGQPDRALELVAEAELAAHRDHLNDLLACAQLAKGIVWLTQGRYADAYEAIREMFDPAQPGYHQRERFDGVMYLAEAAASAHRCDDARVVVADLEAVGSLTPSPLLHTQLGYARAVLAADDDTAHEHYRRALAGDLTRWPWLRARLQLSYGGRLARGGRPAQARPLLTAARATFTRLRAPYWCRQASIELAALDRPRHTR